MKKLFIVWLFFVGEVLSNGLLAQTDVDLDPELGGRLSFSVDKKLARGLHLSLDEEIRMDGNFGSFERFHTTVSMSYKLNDYLKMGVGYALINGYDNDNSAFKSARHRLMADVAGSVIVGNWRLSIRERFQATYRCGEMNEYQSPRTALMLKSRLKVQYKGFRRIEPYAYVELRHILNAPVINAVYNTATDTWGYYSYGTFYNKGDEGWFLEGFRGGYMNRLRGSVGFDYRLTRRSSIDVALMADYCMSKEVDANAEGTKLKSYTRETGFVGWITAGYSFSF